MLTPDRNKALIRRWLEEVFSCGDLDAADGLFTSNCALHDPSFPRDVYGSEGIKRYVCTYRVAFSDLEVTVEIQLAEEDKIITRWTARGTHSGELLRPSVTACAFSGSHRVQEGPMGKGGDTGSVL
jgi:predicted ester cyclase